jgi:hypothetical protein
MVSSRVGGLSDGRPLEDARKPAETDHAMIGLHEVATLQSWTDRIAEADSLGR